jgi:hypothetical protein
MSAFYSKRTSAVGSAVGNTAGARRIAPFKFDLDQIQGRRARIIVNDGSAFCETGASRGVSWRLHQVVLI